MLPSTLLRQPLHHQCKIHTPTPLSAGDPVGSRVPLPVSPI